MTKITEAKKLIRCAACKGEGYSDHPVRLMICPICHGKGKVRA